MIPTNTDVDMSGRPVTGNLIIFLIGKKKTEQVCTSYRDDKKFNLGKLIAL